VRNLEKPIVGNACKYVDETGKTRDALITAVHSETSVNLVVVSDDPSQTDSYGRKIERETSQVHQSLQTAKGRYFY